MIKKIKETINKIRPPITYYWWWDCHLCDIFFALSIFLKWLIFYKIPIIVAILSFIVGTMLPVRTKKEEKIKEIIKIDTIYIFKTDTVIKYKLRSTYRIDTVWESEYIVKRETTYQKQIEKEKEIKIMEKKETINPYLIVGNKLPLKTEQTKFGAGLEIGFWKINFGGTITIDPKLKLDNEIYIKLEL